MTIGLSIGGVLLALLVAVIIGALIYIRRRKRNPSENVLSAVCINDFFYETDFENLFFSLFFVLEKMPHE